MELTGICLGALAIGARTRHLRAFEDNPPPVNVTLGTAHEVDTAHPINPMPTAEERLITTEERVARLESSLAALRQGLDRQIGSLRDDAVTAAGNRAADVEHNLRTALSRTERLLTGIARDGFAAKLAVALLLLGLGAQVTSTVLQIIYGVFRPV